MTNPLLRKVKVASVARSPYECLGLTDNPFPLEPSLSPGTDDPRLNGRIYSEELTRDKEADVERLLVCGGIGSCLSVAFLMDYATSRGRGIGKSAFLKHQCDKIMEDFGERASKGNDVVFAVHVNPPPSCRKFWELCSVIIETLFQQDIVAKAVWRLRASSRAIPDEVLEQVGTAEKWEKTIGDDSWLTGQGINVMWDLNHRVMTAIRQAGVPEDLARDLACSASVGSGRGRMPDSFSSYSFRKGAAECLFQHMVSFFRVAGFTRGLLFIDEVEKVVYHQNMQERRIFAESMRYYLFDSRVAAATTRFYGILLTIHPGVQELLLSHWKTAGLDRLAPLAQPDAQQSTVYFGPLDSEMARPLVKVYLDFYRTPESTGGGIEPFTEDALVEALVKSSGVPGPTLRLLHRVVEEAVRLGATIIGKDLVEQVFSSGGQLQPSTVCEDQTPPPIKVDLVET